MKKIKKTFIVVNLSNISLYDTDYSNAFILNDLSLDTKNLIQYIRLKQYQKNIIDRNVIIVADDTIKKSIDMELIQNSIVDAVWLTINQLKTNRLTNMFNYHCISDLDMGLNITDEVEISDDPIACKSAIINRLNYILKSQLPNLMTEMELSRYKRGNEINISSAMPGENFKIILKDSNSTLYVQMKIVNERLTCNLEEFAQKIYEKKKYTILFEKKVNNTILRYWFDSDVVFDNGEISYLPRQEYDIVTVDETKENISISSFSNNKVKLIHRFISKEEKIVNFATPLNRHAYICNFKSKGMKLIKVDTRTVNRIYQTSAMYINPEQEQYNINQGIKYEDGCYFSLNSKAQPEKLLVTFPGFNTSTNINYAVTKLGSMKERLSNVSVLAFQDYSLQYGSYMVYDENGEELTKLIISKIKDTLNKAKLSEEDLVFYGNSKGGSIALQYTKEFPKARFIVDAPQIEVRTKPLNGIVKHHFDETIYLKNDFRNLICMKNENIYYGYSESDIGSNANILNDKIGTNYNSFNNLTHGHVIRAVLPVSIDLCVDKTIWKTVDISYIEEMSEQESITILQQKVPDRWQFIEVERLNKEFEPFFIIIDGKNVSYLTLNT